MIKSNGIMQTAVCVCSVGESFWNVRLRGGGASAQVVEHDVGIIPFLRQLRGNRGAKDAPRAVYAVAKSRLEKGKCAVDPHDIKCVNLIKQSLGERARL